MTDFLRRQSARRRVALAIRGVNLALRLVLLAFVLRGRAAGQLL